MLKIKTLDFRYPGGKTFSFPDFECKPGENLLILGESGSGKTTLLHLLSGILTAESGEISYNGSNLSLMETSQRDAFRGKNIGMIFQKHFFMEGLSVLENLKAAQRLSGNKQDIAHLNNMMEKLGILHLANEKPFRLSQGEQQRFSIARALANKPLWVLADEPTSSLDDSNCEKFVELIKMPLVENPPGWIIATHDQRLKNHFTNIYKL